MLTGMPLQANDGRNRYEQGISSEVVYWYAPPAPAAGYRMLAEDMAGGADGDTAFRWVNREALAMVRLASLRTAEVMGLAQLPYPVFDLTSENADTPLKFGKDGPRGRHPGGSHDGGFNLDLGYYLTSEKGKVETPDFAACTEHYRPDGKGGEREAHLCTSIADRLDTPRQTFFILELVRTHMDALPRQILHECS